MGERLLPLGSRYRVPFRFAENEESRITTGEKNGGDDETRTRDLCRDRGSIIVYRDVYRSGGPCPEERPEDIRSSRCVSGSDFDRCREKAMDRGYQNVFCHSVARR